MADVIPGAEAWSTDGGPHGALVIHGFTGNPVSMRPLAEAFAAAGFAVELPRLPGHGTTVDDMLQTGWPDWSAEAEAAYQRLAARVDKVVVAGLSMGGTLTLWLAERHPEIAGIVCVNAAVQDPGGMVELLTSALEGGQETMDAIGDDIAKEGVTEQAYDRLPVRPLLSLMGADEEVRPRLADIRCPVLVFTSTQDHVVDPSSSDTIANGVSGPVERVTLERSYHVATLDHDADLIEKEAVAFAQRVCAS